MFFLLWLKTAGTWIIAGLSKVTTWLYSGPDENKSRRLILTVLLAGFIWCGLHHQNTGGGGGTVIVPPNHDVVIGPGGITVKPTPGETPIKPVWHNPSSNVVIHRATPTPDNNSQPLTITYDMWGLRVVPHVHILWSARTQNLTPYLGAQIVWYDAYAIGPAFGQWDFGLVLDRRFKIAQIENIALAVALLEKYQDALNLEFKPYIGLGLSVYLGH